MRAVVLDRIALAQARNTVQAMSRMDFQLGAASKVFLAEDFWPSRALPTGVATEEHMEAEVNKH